MAADRTRVAFARLFAEEPKGIHLVATLAVLCVVVAPIALWLTSFAVLGQSLLEMALQALLGVPIFINTMLVYTGKIRNARSIFAATVVITLAFLALSFLMAHNGIVLKSTDEWVAVVLVNSILMASANAVIFPILLIRVSPWIKPEMPTLRIGRDDMHRMKQGEVRPNEMNELFAEAWLAFFQDTRYGAIETINLFPSWSYMHLSCKGFSLDIQRLFQQHLVDPSQERQPARRTLSGQFRIWLNRPCSHDGQRAADEDSQPLAPYAIRALMELDFPGALGGDWLMQMRVLRERLRGASVDERDYTQALYELRNLASFVRQQQGRWRQLGDQHERLSTFERQLTDVADDLEIFGLRHAVGE